MSISLNRRKVLYFLGGAAGVSVLDSVLPQGLMAQSTPLSFTPFRLPIPLEVYKQNSSWYATGIGKGTTLPPNTVPNLPQFTVIDDVVVPPEFERYVIIQWGDRVFPNKDDYFGYNCDYTAYVPITGDSEGWLWVNHEYVSYPFSKLCPEAPDNLPETNYFSSVVGFGLPTASTVAALSPSDRRKLFGEFLYNLGGSTVRIKKNNKGRYAVVRDLINRRLSGLSGLAINSTRTDAYKTVTSWGSLSHQIGNDDYLEGTGPAVIDVFNMSSDGLGKKIIGTAYNCSGGTTPWGTILSGEENFQGSKAFFVGVSEPVKPDGTQLGYVDGTTGKEFGLVGEKYGWMVEVDLGNASVRGKKHTALGRFRHENIVMRIVDGKKLVAYMGDDRRGGHTYKFVSNGVISGMTNKQNSRLFENGTLYVAKYSDNGTGTWIPLLLNTPTNPNKPIELSSVQLQEQGAISDDKANTNFPRRSGIAGQTIDGGAFGMTTINQATSLPGYQGKTLADFYPTQGAILVDAFLASNLIGGTPGGRPEDLEIHPTTNEVFISYTDNRPSIDGYPDSRIFVVAKYKSKVNAAQHFGGLYKIKEDSADGSGLTFKWEIFKQGGEDGTEGGAGINAPGGAGFAFSDNLAFDPQGNLFGVIDMSTERHNGFSLGSNPVAFPIDHSVVGRAEELLGCFGNNWMYVIPASGAAAGQVVPFAQGPVRSEMTGPTFVGNHTLLLAVQHPCENVPISSLPLNRTIQLLALDGTTFDQSRTVPIGSNWPSNLLGNPSGAPRPAVIGIRRKNGGQFI